MNLCVDWRNPDFDLLPVGGKARSLATLARAGLPVPRWTVVLPHLSSQRDSDVSAALLAYFESYSGPWAVRSSALDEDGKLHSFAGQLESYLNVEASELIEKIAAVRRSGFSERIVLYREQAGLSLPPPMPAVIVQEMVPAESAGVAFSADPVSGRRGLAIVASVPGLGERLVSGEVNSDNFHVDREGHITRRELADGASSSLSDAEVIAIAALARKVEKLFGQPQDIEWALAGGKLHLLQARPITSIAGLADPDAAWQLWDNSNIAESYGGVTTPLTFSFAREVYEEVYRQFVKILRVPAHRIEAGRDVFARMLGLIRGRVYYNLLSWYRVLAMLPGFAVNRHFMEQMMGVKEGLPEEALPYVTSPHKPSLKDYAEIGGMITGLVACHWTLPSKIRAFYARLDEVLRPGAIPIEQMRPDELAVAYRLLQRQLLTRWDAPLINDFFAMIYFGLSRKLLSAWCGDDDGTLQNDLIACQGGIISAEPAQRILSMAELARHSPRLLDVLEKGTYAEIEATFSEHAAFADAFRSYVEKFGDRCLEELKLESETLHDNPLLLLRSIAQLARKEAPPAQPSMEDIGAEARRRADRALAGHPLRRPIFDFVISRTKDRVRDRENLRFERTRVFGRVRRIFVEIGKRLHALDVLDDPRDIFYLAAEESLGFIEGTAITTDLKALAGIRRAEFERWRAEGAADRFETRGPVYVGQSYEGTPRATDAESGSSKRKGIGCCPGIIRGRARVVLDPRGAKIEPGEILVALRTDPGWIMLFPAAAGLLVEHGSLLSHSAIVAREMGIPAVVSIDSLTSWLRTGDEVEFDGRTGEVTRLSAAPSDSSDA